VKTLTNVWDRKQLNEKYLNFPQNKGRGLGVERSHDAKAKKNDQTKHREDLRTSLKEETFLLPDDQRTTAIWACRRGGERLIERFPRRKRCRMRDTSTRRGHQIK